MEWQPIETAQSYDVVLVASPDHGRLPVIAWKIEGVWYELGVYGQQLRPQPTIWIRWPRIIEASASQINGPSVGGSVG